MTIKNKDEIIAELKAENETLKKVKDFACINLQNYIADNNKLKAENERLQKDKIGLHSEIKQLEQENYGLNQELLGYKKGVQASEIIELKQTLQEIKKFIAKICKEECGYVQKRDVLIVIVDLGRF